MVGTSNYLQDIHDIGDNDVCGKEGLLYVHILDKVTWLLIILRIFFCIDAKKNYLSGSALGPRILGVSTEPLNITLLEPRTLEFIN